MTSIQAPLTLSHLIFIIISDVNCLTWNWHYHRDRYISGHNFHQTENVPKLEDCRQLCEAMLDPCCVSLDYDAIFDLCSFNKVNTKTVSLTIGIDAFYYERDPAYCFEQKTTSQILTTVTNASDVSSSALPTSTWPTKPTQTTISMTTSPSTVSTSTEPKAITSIISTSASTSSTVPQSDASPSSSGYSTDTPLSVTNLSAETTTFAVTDTMMTTTSLSSSSSASSFTSSKKRSSKATTAQVSLSFIDRQTTSKRLERPPVSPKPPIKYQNRDDLSKNDIGDIAIASTFLIVLLCFIIALLSSDLHRLYEDFQRYSPFFSHKTRQQALGKTIERSKKDRKFEMSSEQMENQ